MEDRLAELEVRVAFQDRTIQELNDALTRQQRELVRLAREVETLQQQLRTLAPAWVASRDEETPPPHY